MAPDNSAQPQNDQPVQWTTADEGVTTSTAPLHMRFVRLSKSDLEYLKSANSTLELAFFGICAGGLISVFTTLKTVTLTDPTTHAVFIVLTVVLSLLTGFFGLAAWRGDRRWRKKIDPLIKKADLAE